jgi:DNA-binding response OmpR family regulator
MKKILVVEDDADLLTLLQYNLEKEGFSPKTVATGRDAISECRTERPDLILLDIMLPDCDGLELCKSIRADPQLQDTPIIFLTARASETDRIIGLEIGANDYVIKPFPSGNSSRASNCNFGAHPSRSTLSDRAA